MPETHKHINKALMESPVSDAEFFVKVLRLCMDADIKLQERLKVRIMPGCATISTAQIYDLLKVDWRNNERG